MREAAVMEKARKEQGNAARQRLIDKHRGLWGTVLLSESDSDEKTRQTRRSPPCPPPRAPPRTTIVAEPSAVPPNMNKKMQQFCGDRVDIGKCCNDLIEKIFGSQKELPRQQPQLTKRRRSRSPTRSKKN